MEAGTINNNVVQEMRFIGGCIALSLDTGRALYPGSP